MTGNSNALYSTFLTLLLMRVLAASSWDAPKGDSGWLLIMLILGAIISSQSILSSLTLVTCSYYLMRNVGLL